MLFINRDVLEISTLIHAIPYHITLHPCIFLVRDEVSYTQLLCLLCCACILSIVDLTQDQLEDVVRDEVAAARVAHQVECLGEVHRSLLVVDLEVRSMFSKSSEG